MQLTIVLIFYTYICQSIEIIISKWNLLYKSCHIKYLLMKYTQNRGKVWFWIFTYFNIKVITDNILYIVLFVLTSTDTSPFVERLYLIKNIMMCKRKIKLEAMISKLSTIKCYLDCMWFHKNIKIIRPDLM